MKTRAKSIVRSGANRGQANATRGLTERDNRVRGGPKEPVISTLALIE